MNEQITLPASRLSGRFRYEVRREGKVIQSSPWFDNLITNAGLEALGEAKAIGGWCAVGTGNATPAFTDTVLQSQIAAVAGGSTSQGVVTSGTRYGWQRRNYSFAQGAVIGNVAEIGVGWNTTVSLFSRALVSPTVSITSIDQLTVTYEVRMYVPTADKTGTVTIGGTTYNYVLRAAYADAASAAGSFPGWAPGFLALSASTRQWCNPNYFGGGFGCLCFVTPAVVDLVSDTALRVSTGGANAAQAASPSFETSVSNAAYTGSSLQCQFTFTFGTANANGNLKGFLWQGMFGTYQMQLDATVPKNNTKVLTMTFKQTWARR
jgi:hypothetical protein